MKRILVYGTTGVGKSSLIKLITGIQEIETGDSASGCTKDARPYKFNFANESKRETMQTK
jgi:ribosome biogenesis GTPase A